MSKAKMIAAVKLDTLRRPSALWEYLSTTSPGPALPAALQQAGVSGIELSCDIYGRPDEDNERFKAIKQEIRRWQDLGFSVLLHPYAHSQADPAAFTGPASPAAATLQQMIDLVAGQVVALTYHPAETYLEEAGFDPRPYRARYLEASKAFFRYGWEYIEKSSLDVTLLCETACPVVRADMVRLRSGDRPEEVQAILGGRKKGICLDTGHYLLAVRHLGAGDIPPFLAAVNHMHLHDVAAVGDHQPLSPTATQVLTYFRLAVAAGGLKSYTLEYNLNKVVPEAEKEKPEVAVLNHLRETITLLEQNRLQAEQ
ncbi:MAG TPA: hypothetical protein GXX29_07770 [Firmicutes bacterium]|nr:hypothetical protein [Bacillota bacterium]